METHKQSEYAEHGIPVAFVQDNFSHSSRGVLRGLHFQIDPKTQGKLIWPVRGEIYDVAVDIRKGSPHYGRWVGVRLSSENPQLLYVPVGFAHGFQVLSEEADIHYKVTDEYSPEHERGIIWNDEDLSIQWPIEIPSLTQKDSHWPSLAQSGADFVLQKGP